MQFPIIKKSLPVLIQKGTIISRFHPNCSQLQLKLQIKATLTDDNGITGPDQGHSEVVFKCFQLRCFQQMHLSL